MTSGTAKGSLERISDLRLFTRIVACGSLSAAAREQGLALASVSVRLAGLERSLGVRLMHRNTRQLSLTAEGEVFLARLLPALRGIDDLEDAITGGLEALHGRLRITASVAFARRHIAPLVPLMRERHPEVWIDLVATDRTLDLVAEGVDLAIRQAPMADSNLVVRRLIANDRVACASPAYLARSGTPAHPRDLARHGCIVMGSPPQTAWPFVRADGEAFEIEVEPVFRSNDGDVAHEAALHGAGVALKSRIDVTDDIVAGRLVDLFPDWSSPGSPIQAVFPTGEQVPEKVRAFLALLTESLTSKDVLG